MSAMVSFHVIQSGVDRLLKDPAGPLGQHMLRILNQITGTAQTYANVDTGLMRSTIHYELFVEDGGLVGTVGAYTDYAVYVHELNPFLTDAMDAVLG